MLAAMCDLIVAADDAVFSNPVLRLTGAGVELLVEPWELGIRKAKEFLLTGETIDAQEAWRLGLVNRVVPRAELAERARELADRIALVPAVTAQTVKDTLNQTGTLMGKRDALKYHFMAHHWVHNTATALDALGGAQGQGLHEGGQGRDGRGPGEAEGMSEKQRGPLEGIRVVDVGTRISAPFCAGLLGELGADVIKVELPGAGDFMRTMGPFVPVEDGPGYSLSWAVEGRGRRGVTCDLRQPEGKELFGKLMARADVLCENFRPGTMERWGLGPEDLADDLVYVRISVFGQSGPYAPRPGLDRLGIAFGGLLHLTGEPDRPPVRPGVTVSDYLTGVFAAFAAVSALYGRDIGRAGRRGRVRRRQGVRRTRRRGHRRAAVRVHPAHLGMDAGRLRQARHRPPARGQPALALGPARQLSHRGRRLHLHRGGIRRQLRAALRRDGAARADRRPALRQPCPARRTRRRDQRPGGGVDVEPDRLGDHGPLCRTRRARRHRLQRGRHLRRPPYGRTR